MTSTRPIVELTERQGLLSEMRRRSAAVPAPAAREGPWIAVSRQLASGGDDLAPRLGAALGWAVYDREILAAIAAGTHRAERALERFDEKGVRHIGEYFAPLILPEDPGQARYLAELARVARELGRAGRAVLVGRGVNFLLDPRGGLRVRCVAPAADRAAALALAEGLSAPDAVRRIALSDAAQREFVRQAFQRDIDDPAGYDLVLQPLSLGPEATAGAILAAARAKLGLSIAP
jgi:hypothetical protein